jgi:serine O-acetyltransferase
MIGKNVLRPPWVAVNLVRLLPCLCAIWAGRNRDVILADLERWVYLKNDRPLRRHWTGIALDFAEMMTAYPEFRSVLYYRLGWVGRVLKPLMKPMSTLFIQGEGEIGPGLYFQHGFATIVAARKIGKNCWINQQVTIGYIGNECPTLGDNVKIWAGAKVLGNVTVGDNSVVGANAVVVKNVPPDCTVVGVPAYIVRRGGARVTEPLK